MFIHALWIDWWINETGSLILLEGRSVHGGSQSMRFNYENYIEWGAYSETERTFADPRNWSALGIKALSVYFYGDPDNDAESTEQMYMGLEDSSGPASYAEVRYGDNGEDMNDIKVAEWQRWVGDFSESGVNLSAVKKIYIGFGDRANPVAGGNGDVYFDDIEGCSQVCLENKPYADLTDDCAVNYEDLKVLCEQWLETGSLAADLYPDNRVDYRDFAVLANEWLEGKLWP